MPKKVFHFCWHISKWSVRLFAFCFLCVFLLVALLVWRLNSAPLDINFAKGFIEQAMYDRETGASVSIGKVVLYWPDLYGPLYLEMENAELHDKQEQSLVEVGQVAVSFSRYGMLFGRVLPKAIVIKEPHVRFIRKEDGSFDFNLGEGLVDDNERAGRRELTTRIFGYIARPGYESAKRSVISRLQELRIEDARLSVNDELIKQSWSLPDFDMSFVSTSDGMHGEMQVELPDEGLTQSTLMVELDYYWDQKNVELSADIENVSLRSLAEKVPELKVVADQNVVMNAHIETLLDEYFMPTDVRVDITSAGGELFHPEVSDAPIAYQDLSVKAVYNHPSSIFKMEETHVTLGGVTVNMSGDITYDDRSVTGPVKVWVDEAAHDLIVPLWPKMQKGSDAETWIIKRMSGGIFKDVSVSFDVAAHKILTEDGLDSQWVADVENTVLKFACEGMDIDYRAPLDPARDVYGQGVFDFKKDELSIDIEKGFLGSMAVGPSKLYFDEVEAVGAGDAYIDVALPNAKIVDVMRYISKEPINLGKEIDMDLAQVKGRADLNVSLKFPTQPDVKMEEFEIGAKATLRDVFFPEVLEELDLEGGPYDFDITDGLVTMKGSGLLEKREVNLTWQRFLDSKGKPFKEKVKAAITADPNIRQMLGIDLSEFIEGSLPIDVDYTSYRNGDAKASVRVDAGPALFFVEPFDFAKPAGDKASARFNASFKKGLLQNISDLSAEGQLFSLKGGQIDFIQKDGKTELSSGHLPDFALDETRGALDFSFDEKGKATIEMRASVLDARPFMKPADPVDANSNAPAEPYSEPPMAITTHAQKVISATGHAVYDAYAYMDIDDKGRFNEMKANARIGEKASVKADFKPDEQGVRRFVLKTDDAGGLLKAFQFYDDIVGGSMVIRGISDRSVSDRNIKGFAEIKDFKVVNAPSLTKILSVLSLTGIGDALSNDGLNFDRLESNFEWIYRPAGSLLIVKDGRTSGNSLGLLFGGRIDNAERKINVSGTVVPMDGLNKFIEKIPLLGDILTGGSGGVFAATYEIKGSTDAPEISVNPLSVITPGIIRSVLWE